MNPEGLKFYRCDVCGNLMMVVVDPNVIPTCCEHEMHVLECNSDTSKADKHVPIIERHEDHVSVGISIQEHPMEPSHHIEWIALTDGKRVELQRLSIDDEPYAIFSKMNTKSMLRAFSYCNIDGLWTGEK